MRIELNVLGSSSSTAMIYAYAEEWESGPTLHGIAEVKAIKIHHGSNYLSFEPLMKTPKHCDNDYFVSYKSKVPFREFVTQFLSSSYKNNNDYNLKTHNCAHAADYALRLAGIVVSNSFKDYLPRIDFGAISFIQSSVTLTPDKLYLLARSYKIKNIEPQVHFKYELVSKALFFWSRRQQTPVNQDSLAQADVILSEVAGYQKTRAHHLEQYIKILIDTIDLLITQQNTVEAVDAYKHFANQFMVRDPSRAKQLTDQFIMRTFFIALISTPITMVFNTNDPSLTQQLLFGVGLLLILYYALHNLYIEGNREFQRELKNHFERERKHTPLSHAMLNFSTFFSNKSVEQIELMEESKVSAIRAN